ncbi:hypothetical protein NDU88_004569 [Pleurodeles waltl]|uniref:Uncharacterized protein n=1 Tax=Pleurodeles waltl TaxID=8319 RepID=A0AAV7NLF3_PLEWA|nr:hypothetical protein NDU88_004569 [Pleurodeles waltl]
MLASVGFSVDVNVVREDIVYVVIEIIIYDEDLGIKEADAVDDVLNNVDCLVLDSVDVDAVADGINIDEGVLGDTDSVIDDVYCGFSFYVNKQRVTGDDWKSR